MAEATSLLLLLAAAAAARNNAFCVCVCHFPPSLSLLAAATAAYDDVGYYVDKEWIEFDPEEGPAPKGLRVTQVVDGVDETDVLDWRARPVSDFFSFWNSWFAVDIGRGRRLRPTHYCLRNG